MSVLSIDVGLKNLALCLMEENLTVRYWNVLEVSGVQDMLEQLDSVCPLDEINEVIIEKQPSFNPKMRTVACALQSYFIIRGQIDNTNINKIIFYSAKYKLQICEGSVPKGLSKSQRYRFHKKMAIDECRRKVEDNETLSTFFGEHKKKDDLADSYLQAVSYISSKEGFIGVVPRKPTPKQIKSKKLTLSNIKFLTNIWKTENIHIPEREFLIKKIREDISWVLNDFSIDEILNL